MACGDRSPESQGMITDTGSCDAARERTHRMVRKELELGLYGLVELLRKIRKKKVSAYVSGKEGIFL